jgi:glycosyltransferase involved in cell wall biosynthesis
MLHMTRVAYDNLKDSLAQSAAVDRRPAPALPLVSVVIVNYNYGRFLEDAVESVRGQTYPNVECIIVDNASTDESGSVIDRLQQRHPELVIVQRASNDGQTPASLDGLAISRGHYVIFLDADDYLLPTCVETHVYVHLSMRPHIGFTSGDMLQLSGRHVVVGTGEESSRYIGRGQRRRPKLVRPYAATPGWPSEDVRTDIAQRIYYVPPLKTSWIWSSTSGLCYRRDALMLFADNDRLSTLRTGTDFYFAVGCSGLSGSVIIDTPVFAYRTHGGNIYSARPQLDRTLNFSIGGHGDSNIHAQLYLVDHLAARAARFAPNLVLKINLLALLFKVDRADIDRDLPRWARRSRAAQAIARHYSTFSQAFGPGLARLALAVFARSLRAPHRLAEDLPLET